jgi:S1-C subfamily serine protease
MMQPLDSTPSPKSSLEDNCPGSSSPPSEENLSLAGEKFIGLKVTPENEVWLQEAIISKPSPSGPPVTPDAKAQTSSVPAPAVPWQGYLVRGLWGFVVPATFFLAITLIILYIAPAFLHHWRLAEAQADAEAAYLKRRAELRADAEHAEQRLDVLDKRLHLASLGFREVVRKVSPLVVNVAHLIQPNKKDLDPFLQPTLIYDPEKDQKYFQTGVGSGIMVKPGFILTNHHVIKGAHRLRVTFASGQSLGLEPDTVASDPLTDLAVIRLPENLPPGIREDTQVAAEFANSDKDVQVGDWALAVGSPLGLRQTVTQGVISAKGRLLNMLLVELLQTDAAINPGNSGGPLFDQYGRVMGINVAIASDNGRNQGIGFAIPSNTARNIFDKLATEGEVPRGYLGIALDDLTGPRVKELALEDGGGVLVTKVMPNQPASKAGLQGGDIIVRFNDDLFARNQPGRQLRQLISEVEPGTEVRLEVLREGQRLRLPVTVGRRPADLP